MPIPSDLKTIADALNNPNPGFFTRNDALRALARVRAALEASRDDRNQLREKLKAKP